MKKKLTITSLITLLSVSGYLLHEVNTLMDKLWKSKNRIEFQEKWISELRKDTQ